MFAGYTTGLILMALCAAAQGDFVNSIGLDMKQIPAGEFMMGSDAGQWDEAPAHKVTITAPFYMSATEITNAQYELFDPAHKALRGKNGFSVDDNEAVVFVSWNDANDFCRWLSEKENRPYRLPTEAQWEYACRAGTATDFYTGDTLPKEYHKRQENCEYYEPVKISVGVTEANTWGLYDMHGNVEEWCGDWYAAYPDRPQTDPIGASVGIVKVTRGGSHSTDVAYLRSANRMGTLPDDKSQLIGFRVVAGAMPSAKPVDAQKPLCMTNVSQAPHQWPKPADAPYFAAPMPYLHEMPKDAKGPVFGHNHCPSVTWCDNGDMLVIWFSTPYERSRDMLILGSRLRAGADAWEEPSVFFHVPDRNLTGSSLINDGGTIYHFNGLDTAYHWRNLAMVMRTSDDNGATWSQPRIISPEHGLQNQVISGTIITSKGVMVQACDGGSGGSDGSVIHLGTDGGKTWINPPLFKTLPVYEDGKIGNKIAGIHAGIVELNDGSLMALGRENNIGGNMPKSVSKDMGKSWTYSDSGLPPISGAQRLVLTRLKEGAIMLVSFTDIKTKKDGWLRTKGMMIKDESGTERKVYGMYAALSFDEGKTWPVRKLVTNGEPAKEYYGGGWTNSFTMDQTYSEPGGYLAATQSPDGIIHLVSSGLYYRFNFEWLKMPMPAIK